MDTSLKDSNGGKKRGNIKRFLFLILKIFLIALSVIIVGIAVAIGIYAHNNMNYDKNYLASTMKAGFKEKNIILNDKTVINYAEGPNNGPSLLLIHGQSMAWEDYSTVLPALAKYYHVFAIDCHGHGKSSHEINKYNAVSMGRDFIWFIKNVIGEPCVVSGHSSGGLLAAWLAANSPKDVLGIVLEDPPFFSVEPDEMQDTFVWRDGFTILHDFLYQSEEKDYVVYYMKHSYFFGLFGGLQPILADQTADYRKDNPGKPLKLWEIPQRFLHGLYYMDNFDLYFSETFYDGSWFNGFNQQDTLSKITCPSIYIKAATLYGKDGVLYAANSNEDAEKLHSLIKGNEMITIVSGHDIHFEHPDEFVQILVNLLNRIQK